jgi:cell division protein FtsW (lipid II flippase)
MRPPILAKTIFEGLLLVAAVLLISILGKPLTVIDLPQSIPGYFAKAKDHQLASQPSPEQVIAAESSQVQKERLYRGFGVWYAVIALTAWFTLIVGRQRAPSSTLLCVIASIWVALMTLTNWGKSWSASTGWIVVCTLLVAPIFLSRMLSKLGVPWQEARGPRSVLVFPGLVFIAGIGLIWLLDFFAHSYPKFWQGNYPTKHFVDLVHTFSFLTAIASVAPTLLWTFSKVATWLGRPLVGTPKQRIGRVLVWTLCLAVWIAPPIIYFRLNGNEVTATCAEMIRVPFWIILGWMAYRWAELVPRWRTLMGVVFAAFVVTMLLLAFTKDMGQVLLNLAVLTIFGSGVTVQWYARPSRRFIIGVTVCILILGVLTIGLFNIGPYVGRHIGLRIAALDNPFNAYDEYLALLRWFGGEAGLFGFGIGTVPWCGYFNTLVGTCGGGIPSQTPSDYSYFGLVGVWGFVGAALCVVGLTMWLIVVLRAVFPKRPMDTRAYSPQLLAAWLVSVFGIAMLVQIFLTSMGSLGVFPLTGVTMPLLSLGKASLLVCALYTAFAVSDIQVD